jgi:hypothetical protein
MNPTMTKTERKRILKQAQEWFRTVILPNHLKNTRKLATSTELDINPFLAPHLAVYLTGEISPEALAKVLIYPRVLGSSINTSFGQNIQKFISDVLGSFGSLVSGIDIEFVDQIDGRKKYCQVKLGPNTINKDDVASIHGHFKSARNLGRTNNVQVAHGDLVVAILYGEPGQESNHYKRLRDEHGYPLYIGNDFWHRLTGDDKFYDELRIAIAEVAMEADGMETLNDTIHKLAATDKIKQIAQSKA